MNDQNNRQSGTGTQVTSKSSFMKDGNLIKLTPTPGYGLPLGDPISYSSYLGTSVTPPTGVNVTVTYPGVMVYKWLPTAGRSLKQGDAINTAALKIYRKIQDTLRQRNLPFDRNDVMIHLYALDGLCVAFRTLGRLYKLTNSKSKYNKYLGPELIRMLGADAETFIQNRPAIRDQMILWKDTLDEICIPADCVGFIDLHVEMSDYLFFEEADIKSQAHMFAPDAFLDYQNVDTGGPLKFTSLPANYRWDQFRDMFDSMLASVSNSTDFDIINAAIDSTFGTHKYTFDIPGDEDEFEYVYDEAALYAIKNAVVTDSWDRDTLIPKAEAATGLIICNPRIINVKESDFDNSFHSMSSCVLFDSPTANPSPTFMANALRWHPMVLSNHAIIATTGTEILTSMRVYTMEEDGSYVSIYKYELNSEEKSVQLPAIVERSYGYGERVGDYSDPAPAALVVDVLCRLNYFTYHPIVYVESRAGDIDYLLPFANFRFVSKIDVDDLMASHRNLVYSTFVDGITGAQSSAPTEESKDEQKRGRK